MILRCFHSDPAFLDVFDGNSVNIRYRKLKILTMYSKNLCHLHVLPVQEYKNNLKNKVAGKWAFYKLQMGVYITIMVLKATWKHALKLKKGNNPNVHR